MKQEELIQTNINEEKLYENEIKSEQRINSSDKEININDYSEIIPQKIEKEKYYISTENDDILKQNLEFSFGKNSKKIEELNRLKTDYLDKKEILSDNLSNYQLTDSLTNLIEKEDDNKKLKLIKEKFISNFKSKVRSESLEKAFTLFEKFHHNLGNNNYNKMNMSCSQKLVKPFQFLASQNTNSLTIIDNNNKRQKDNNKNIIEQNKTLNLTKSNDDFFKYKKRKILRIIKENEKENKENKENNECNNTFDDKEKRKNKKIFYLKNLKKKGIFIRKVIREEKYIIDDDGTEKLIDIKQSTYDTHGNKKKIKKINVNKIIKENNNKTTLFNKKKFEEYIKDKMAYKKNNISNKSINNENNMKNIEINTEYINNKNINKDSYNNIKIVINKINKINSNPKINLNFIKKYKNGKTSLIDENKENKIYNGNNIIIPKYNICQTDLNSDNNNKSIIKINQPLNSSKINLNISNINNNLNKYNNNKIKINIPLMGKLKLIKCEKNYCKKKSSIPFKKTNTNRINQCVRDISKRNYSFKEIKNLSNNSNSNKYMPTNHLERYEAEINNNINNKNNIYDDLKIKKCILDSLNKKYKLKFNHNYYESKSFSSKIDDNNYRSSINNLTFDNKNNSFNKINNLKYDSYRYDKENINKSNIYEQNTFFKNKNIY